MKTRLLKTLRSQADSKLGVFRLLNGKYAVVWDKTLWNDVTEFNEKDWKAYGDEYHYRVVEVTETYNEAVDVCDRCRRSYILGQVRERRYGTKKRVY